MSGRLLGGAIATITGIAIGVATFKPELEAMRRKRLEEEYNREVAALQSAVAPDKPTMATVTPTKQDQLTNDTKKESSKLSSLLGIWAWKKDVPSDAAPRKEPPASNEKSTPGR